MSLHVPSIPEAGLRVKRQHWFSALSGLLFAVALLAALGWLMDGMFSKPVPAYRPQFVMFRVDLETTCGGMIGCRPPIHAPRKPTPPPVHDIRPLGLAPPKGSLMPAFPTDDFPEGTRWEEGTWD